MRGEREEGRKEGRKEGREEEREKTIKMVLGMVNDNIISTTSKKRPIPLNETS